MDSNNPVQRWRLRPQSPTIEARLSMPPPSTLRIEKLLASAHRSLFAAQQEAERSGLLGLEEDLWLMTLEVQRLNEALLRGSRSLSSTRRVRTYPNAAAGDKLR